MYLERSYDVNILCEIVVKGENIFYKYSKTLIRVLLYKLLEQISYHPSKS